MEEAKEIGVGEEVLQEIEALGAGPVVAMRKVARLPEQP